LVEADNGNDDLAAIMAKNSKKQKEESMAIKKKNKSDGWATHSKRVKNPNTKKLR